MCRTACAATNTRVTPQTTYYNKLSAASLLVLTSPIIRAERLARRRIAVGMIMGDDDCIGLDLERLTKSG